MFCLSLLIYPRIFLSVFICIIVSSLIRDIFIVFNYYYYYYYYYYVFMSVSCFGLVVSTCQVIG